MSITIQEIRFGVEIETVGKTRREVADAIRTIVGGTVQHVATPACYDPLCKASHNGSYAE